jgi:hypothetical protein
MRALGWLAPAMVLTGLAGCSRTPLLSGVRDASSHGGEGGSTRGSAGTAGDGSPDAVAAPFDQAPDPSADPRAVEVCRQAILAQCERLYACEGFSVGDCGQFAADLCPGYYFGPRTLRTVEGVEACVPLIRQASCTDVLMGIATQCLPAGLGAAGDPCSSPGECAANSCSGQFPSCGVCAVPLALGASCDVSAGHCASGTICHPRKRVCVPAPLVVAHAFAGEACDTRGQPLVGCAGDLVCVPDRGGGTAGRCASLPGQGEPCLAGGNLPECAPGLRCGTSNQCGNPVSCGATECDANSFCYQPTTGPVGCRPYLAVGESCSRAIDSDRQCAPDGYCFMGPAAGDGGSRTDGICIPLRQIGEGEGCADDLSCRVALVCQGGRCTRFAPASCYSGIPGRD